MNKAGWQIALLVLLCLPGAATAQQDSAGVVAGERYAEGALPERFLGRDYRNV